jgi:hypothetical protein
MFNGAKVHETIKTTRCRSTFDGVKLTGGNQMEVGFQVVVGDLVLQMGFRKSGNKTIPFTDYRTSRPVNVINGDGPFYINAKNTFEVYRHGLNYRYKRNGVDILEFVFDSEVFITDANVHTLAIDVRKFPKVNFYPAVEYDIDGAYVSAFSGINIYGNSIVGFEGREQNISLRMNEVNAGSSIAKIVYGSKLW